jgi:hypothetical protein
VTPPAVSVKIPVVSASRPDAGADLVVGDRIDGALRAAGELRGIGTVGRVADRERLGDRVGPHWPADVGSLRERLRDRRATLRLGAVHRRQRAAHEARVDELLEPARDLREQRARGDRRHDPVGQLPAELLRRLVGERLGALGVVRAQVDVHERPAVALARELRAEPVDGVVVAAHADDLRAVCARGEDLLGLEVGGDEHVGGQTGVGGVRRDRTGQVAGRGAGDGAEAELDRARERDRHDAVLERVRRVGGLVLDPQLAEPEALARRSARTSGVSRSAARHAGRARVAGSRRSARASPARLDPAPELVGARAGRPVGDLQRPEAALTDIERLEWIGGGALLALQGLCRHLSGNPLRRVMRRERARGEAHHRISQAVFLEPDGIATVPGRSRDRMVGGVSLGQSLHPS